LPKVEKIPNIFIMSENENAYNWGPFLTFQSENRPSLHYRTTGLSHSPHKVVFVMGLMGTLHGWEEVAKHFEEKGDQFECLYFDNRGVGLSGAPPGPYTTEEMARDVLCLVQSLGWSEIEVLGISMGGMIAQWVGLLAREYEIRVHHLFLCCTRVQSSWWSGLPSFSVLLNMFYTSIFVAQNDYETQVHYTLPNIFSPEYLQTNDNYAKLLRKFVEIRTHFPPNAVAFRSQLAAVRNHHLTNEQCNALKNETKILAISGDNDKMIPHTCTLAMEDLLDAKITILPGAGHALGHERVKELCRWLEEGVV
jgi:pimeloyl-ACP methyl ester carboxylesterase